MSDAEAPKADNAQPDPKADEKSPVEPKADPKPKANAGRKAAAKPKPPKPPAEAADASRDEPQGLTKDDVARFIDATVRVPRLKDGEPIIKNGVYVVQEFDARAEDILMFRVDGDTLRVVTADGQKFELTR